MLDNTVNIHSMRLSLSVTMKANKRRLNGDGESGGEHRSNSSLRSMLGGTDVVQDSYSARDELHWVSLIELSS